ncbi:MAG: type IV pilus assembly protein PilM [Planctomycetes bacterium]|nr:type IV pilus assembly protein PilM [Planctomycetota bacterium]
MAFFTRQRSLLGVDIGTDSIKAVELTTQGGEPILTGYGQVAVPQGADPAEALADLLKACGFRSRRAATSVSGRSVIVRFLSMAEVPESNLRSAVRFEADKYIPFDLDEVVTDCARLEAAGDSSGEMKVLLVAAKRDIIQNRVELLRRVGLEAVHVDVDPFAVGNAFELVARANNDPSLGSRVSALIDVGASKTTVTVVKGHEPRFTREVYLGGEDFTGAVAKRLGVEAGEAEHLKRAPGERAEEVAGALAHAVDELANEVMLSLDYYEDRQDGEKVEDVYLSGGGSRTPLLEETLERVFERKTATWSPVAGLAVDGDVVDANLLTENAAQLAVSVGLAARVVKEGAP